MPSQPKRSAIRRRNPISPRTAIAENIAAGMSPKEARHAAMRAFDNPTFFKEETRNTWAGLRTGLLGRQLWVLPAMRSVPRSTTRWIMTNRPLSICRSNKPLPPAAADGGAGNPMGLSALLQGEVAIPMFLYTTSKQCSTRLRIPTSSRAPRKSVSCGVRGITNANCFAACGICAREF